MNIGCIMEYMTMNINQVVTTYTTVITWILHFSRVTVTLDTLNNSNTLKHTYKYTLRNFAMQTSQVTCIICA